MFAILFPTFLRGRRLHCARESPQHPSSGEMKSLHTLSESSILSGLRAGNSIPYGEFERFRIRFWGLPPVA